jgi:hypothetical protein
MGNLLSCVYTSWFLNHGGELKVAYVDVNVRYLNRTRDELLNALRLAAEVTCVGPGFSSGDPVSQLQALISGPQQVDVVVTTPHVALANGFADRSSAHIAANYRRSFAYSFDDRLFGSLVALRSLLVAATLPRALFLLEADYYNFGTFEIDSFTSVADAIFGFGPECWAPKARMKHLAEESFASHANDNWADYLSEHGNTVFSFHHLVGDGEFCDIPLSKRKHSWSVLGAGYTARREAIAHLRSHQVTPVVTSPKRKIIGGLKRVGLLQGESNWSLDLVQRDFFRKLCQSRYSYTCGSGLDMPIRKFFEIPAAGAVLVCRPFRGAQDLGFVSGKNYMEAEPQDLREVHRYLENNPDEAQQIASAGRELVRRLHSVSARSEQLHLSLAALMGHKGVGRWKHGQFEIEETHAF